MHYLIWKSTKIKTPYQISQELDFSNPFAPLAWEVDRVDYQIRQIFEGNRESFYGIATDDREWLVEIERSDFRISGELGVDIQAELTALSVSENGTAIIADRTGQVTYFDDVYSDPSGTAQIAEYSGVDVVTVYGNHAYVAADERRIAVVSISDFCPVCFPDLNGDGQLNFFDIATFIQAFSAQDPMADLNDDGAFNFFDVSALIVGYQAGCP